MDMVIAMAKRPRDTSRPSRFWVQIRKRLRWSAAPLQLATLLFLSLASALTDASPPAHEPSQADVEAVYLFDFGKFVRWPAASAQEPLNLCIAGAQRFTNSVQAIVAGEKVDGRALAVRRVLRAEDTGNCSILFIDALEKDNEEDLLAAADGKPMLTVGDAPDFLARGGMIQFMVMAKHVRFSVNLDAVAQHHLSLSSELLKVAVYVKGKPEEGAP